MREAPASHRDAAEPGRRGTLLVPLDGTLRAMSALPVAQAMARTADATLRLLHVGKRVLPPLELLHRLGLTDEQARGSVIDAACGDPAVAIVRAAKEWRSLQIVMCTHTRAEKPRLGMGRTALEVLRLSPCPVVLVPPQRGLAEWEMRAILLPHDGTPATAAAFGPAALLARQTTAELFVLHVAEPGATRPLEPGTFAAPSYVDQPQHEWTAWTREFLDRLCGLFDLPEAVKLRLFLGRGEPGAEILRLAATRRTDLIVLAWHGTWEAERAATVKAVIRDAPCPVLVLPCQPRA